MTNQSRPNIELRVEKRTRVQKNAVDYLRCSNAFGHNVESLTSIKYVNI